MPRAGLGADVVTERAAELADEVGLPHVTMGLLAERLGVRTPSLYKHVDGQEDLRRRIAERALLELGDALRDALQGKAGHDALAAAAHTVRAFVREHPGRYAATVRLDAAGPDDPLTVAGDRVLDSLAAVVAGYDLEQDEVIHALRVLRSLLHGFAVLEAAGGFQMEARVDDSFAWLVGFLDRGLRG